MTAYLYKFMKLLRCKLCDGEMEIISGFRSIFKVVKCTSCGFSNEKEEKNPEIIIIKRK